VHTGTTTSPPVGGNTGTGENGPEDRDGIEGKSDGQGKTGGSAGGSIHAVSGRINKWKGMRKPSTAKGKIFLFSGGLMPILVGNAEKHFEPAPQNPPDIATATVKGSNDIVSTDIVGGLAAGLHYPFPLIFT